MLQVVRDFGRAQRGFVNFRATQASTSSRPGAPGWRAIAASIFAARRLLGLALSTSLAQHSTHLSEYAPLLGRCADDSHWLHLIHRLVGQNFRAWLAVRIAERLG